MGDWALSQCERQEFSALQVSRTAGANTKSSYQQIIAATGFAYNAISLQLNSDGGGGQCYLVDIAIGAGGSEVVIIPNILVDSMRAIGHCGVNITIPVAIAAGTRISAALQEVGGSGTRQVNLALTGRAGGANAVQSPCGTVSNYGALTASSNGTLIDQGAVANTFGSWVQMTAATARDHNALIAVMGTNQTTSWAGSFLFDFQIGIGAGGSEVVIAQFESMTNANGNRMQVNSFDANYAVPAGSRVAMRSKCTSATSFERQATAIILGC